MRVLITGAAGFLGSHLADRFLTDGHAVIGLDNFCTGSHANIEELSRNPRFSFVEQNISDPLTPQAESALAGSLDGVLHFASPASPVDYLDIPVETLRVGSHGTHNCLELARERKARFFLASTSEIYGDPHVHPQEESYWGNVNPVGPRSVYDEAKRFSEAMTMAYHRHHGVDTRIVRIFNTYGPRMRPNDGRVVTNFVVQALTGQPITVYGDGSQTRSFCYVDDEVEGLYRLFMHGDAQPMNIGNPDEYTVGELAAIVQELTGCDVTVEYRPLPTDDPRQRRPDITRAREMLGWEPRVPVREGLKHTIEYFRGLIGSGAFESRAQPETAAAAARP